jgi:hypothetical protein
VVFVETHAFTVRIRSLLPDESYRLFQSALVGAPDLGVVVPGTGGIRKVRWAGSGRGKRGGIRVLYFSHRASSTTLLLFAFAKAEIDDLSAAQKAALRRIIETEYP